jgi:hypothetical protein
MAWPWWRGPWCGWCPRGPLTGRVAVKDKSAGGAHRCGCSGELLVVQADVDRLGLQGARSAVDRPGASWSRATDVPTAPRHRRRCDRRRSPPGDAGRPDRAGHRWSGGWAPFQRGFSVGSGRGAIVDEPWENGHSSTWGCQVAGRPKLVNDLLLFPHCDLHVTVNGPGHELALRVMSRVIPDVPARYRMDPVPFASLRYAFFAPRNELRHRFDNLPGVRQGADGNSALVTANRPGVYLFSVELGRRRRTTDLTYTVPWQQSHPHN